MNKQAIDWCGYWVATPTPFSSTGMLDENAFRSVLRMYHEQGVHGVLINGTTGEWFSQSSAERRAVAEVAVDELSGAIPVVIGCTAFTPSEVIGFAEHAFAAGADGALTTPPPYVHPSEEELLDFYRTVTDSVEIPWMAYNWPRGTAVDMSAELLSRIADLDHVVAIKESSGDELKTMVVGERVLDRVRFFARFIHRRGMAFLREIGGDGNIDGGGLGATSAVAFYNALWRGDLEAARSASAEYSTLVSLLVDWDYSSRFASPTSQVKAAMNLLGQAGGYVRPPLLDLKDPEKLDRLGSALKIAGLSRSTATPAQKGQ